MDVALTSALIPAEALAWTLASILVLVLKFELTLLVRLVSIPMLNLYPVIMIIIIVIMLMIIFI